MKCPLYYLESKKIIRINRIYNGFWIPNWDYWQLSISDVKPLLGICEMSQFNLDSIFNKCNIDKWNWM
jgi:hypothetical protein